MKEFILIEGIIVSKFMFETMSCLSESSMLLKWEETNDAAATSSLLMTTHRFFLT